MRLQEVRAKASTLHGPLCSAALGDLMEQGIQGGIRILAAAWERI